MSDVRQADPIALAMCRLDGKIEALGTKVEKLIEQRDRATRERDQLKAELAQARAHNAALFEALKLCDSAFICWQVGQIPGRPEDILALITKVRAAIALAKG